ncbi:hypothetical protein C7974DRAFT_373919 [Boeremia exigua]|uniref:uncharacterized protein n=1 Tax=Boeremia exigua TaxID=749465 RepID=UPI001E8E64F6|nr:uncharacterized protein C7974DRAFT_373919 [Boeremia exigua]KAH6639721.1 hypothetical protein C7974DRAFT_373919 [Boeremia exigua]
MDYDDYPPPIRRSPRAAHELQRVFEQLQIQNNKPADTSDDDEDGDDYGDQEEIPPLVPWRRLDLYEEPPMTPSPGEPPPRCPSHVNPLRSHPVAEDKPSASTPPAPAPAPAPAPTSVPTSAPTSAPTRPAPRYRYSHPFREQLSALQSPEPAPQPAPEPLPEPAPEPAPRRRPMNLVSYKPANQRLHPRLRRRTSLDTIASVTTTASVVDSEALDDETPSPSMFTLESEYPITPDVDLGPPPMNEPPKPASLPQSLRTASMNSIPSTPVSSAENHPSRGVLQKLKPSKRKDSVGTDCGGERLVIERTVSVDQTSYRSNSSSASNTISSGAPSQYPPSTGNSRSSSTWTASSHDISGLTPEELKKCKKKGINPALFAEMKAARKGKWTSPIAGNTFLA